MRRPKLTFKLLGGSNAPPIKSFTITAPRGLRFAAARKLASGVLVDNESLHTAHIRRGKLIIRLAVPSSELRVTLRWPALVAGNALLRQIHRIRDARKQGRPVKLVFATIITVTDASRNRTRLRIKTAFLVRMG